MTIRRVRRDTRLGDGCQEAGRPRPQAEQRLVERRDEGRPVAVQQCLDERSPDDVERRRLRRLAGAERPQALELVGTVAGGLSQEERPADGRCPEAVGAAKKCGQ